MVSLREYLSRAMRGGDVSGGERNKRNRRKVLENVDVECGTNGLVDIV